MTFAVVVLAAGGSTRMGGRFKLLEDLGGRPLVLWSVEAAMGSRCRPVVVVLGNRAERSGGPFLLGLRWSCATVGGRGCPAA